MSARFGVNGPLGIAFKGSDLWIAGQCLGGHGRAFSEPQTELRSTGLLPPVPPSFLGSLSGADDLAPSLTMTLRPPS